MARRCGRVARRGLSAQLGRRVTGVRANLEAATKESALEEVRRRQVQLVALDDELFNQVPLWHPLLGMPELRAKILARARWQRALGMLKVCKACCSASGTRAWDYFLMDEVD